MIYLRILIIGVLFSACTSKNEHAKLTFLLKGNESFEEGNIDRAIFFYTEAILTDTTYVDAYLNNAIAYEAKGFYYDAIEMYNNVLLLDPSDENALFKRANLYLDVDQYYRALDDLDALGSSWKDSSKLYFTKGLVNTRLKRYETAISEFNNSLKLDASQPQALVNIGNVFYHKSELDSAELYLYKGLELDSKEANGYNTLSLVAIKREEYEDAIKFLNKALSVDNNNAWYLNNKGYAYLKLGELDSAEYLVNTSLKVDPYNAWVYRNKGLLELEKNNLPKAIKMLAKAYKMDNHIDHIAIDLAQAYIKSGNISEACKILIQNKGDEEPTVLIEKYCKK